ncbi:hypothetical protein PsorP6_002770 [Peronosclerospora sorghi]|uniref:Uncharacterized protein n=1 Tax=Peronosclerospora sorghi TaxID=230839 RepID=A0ACC0VIJ6_9STRA|nr:hypothetical protein PsorP6_002770 [Peronosclerospora sorghi]
MIFFGRVDPVCIQKLDPFSMEMSTCDPVGSIKTFDMPTRGSIMISSTGHCYLFASVVQRKRNPSCETMAKTPLPIPIQLKVMPFRRDTLRPCSLNSNMGVPAAYAILSSPNDRAEYDATLVTRDSLVTFYRSYNPDKLDNVTIQTIIDGWHGREVELFEMLKAKYEVAPHQGITKNCQRTSAISISSETSHNIALDSQNYKSKDAGNAKITWTGS